ncbi:MAG: hypothetical protein Q7R67_00875 [bacterium]|nr:hypothetical protein [bacterium]
MPRKIPDDSLTPAQRKKLEQRLFRLGKKKYGLDDQTARKWAKRFAAC